MYNFYTIRTFEFDDQKSRSNLEKHGIDFQAAQQLWRDPDLLEVPVRTDSEQRFLVVGTIENKHWTSIITYRGDSIRIISVRRSRTSEVREYESWRI